MSYKFLGLKKANDNIHKYVATFLNNETNRKKTVKFGGYGYDDYTTFDKSIREERKERYIKRHAKDNLNDALSAGSLSMYLLWGETPSIEDNLKNYLKRFKDQII
jgi:hypothetical protein